jgi:hypothetical protein
MTTTSIHPTLNSYTIINIYPVESSIIIEGTVNGVLVQVSYSASTIFASTVEFQSFIAPIMLAAMPQPTSALTQYLGTFIA